MKELLTPPVLLIIFNRPDLTRRVFERIRAVRPKKLFVAADGPRDNRSGEVQLCSEARSVIEQVDWPCEVKTLLRKHNLGCKYGPSSAITWFFDYVDYGIILEDDCLPIAAFFRFCAELLVRYSNDTRIGMISGNNFGFELYDKTLSYSFSRHGLIWGWATWKRCWKQFDVNLAFLNAANVNLVKSNISNNEDFIKTWWKGMHAVLHENLDAWDYQWGVARYMNNYLTIRPKVNLVANIGWRKDATHTKEQVNGQYVSTGKLEFPLIHPKITVSDCISDKLLEEFFMSSHRKHGIVSEMKRRLDRIRKFVTF